MYCLTTPHSRLGTPALSDKLHFLFYSEHDFRLPTQVEGAGERQKGAALSDTSGGFLYLPHCTPRSSVWEHVASLSPVCAPRTHSFW